MNKTFYFKVGKRDVVVAFPERPIGKFLFFLFLGLCIMDLFHGRLFSAALMGIFSALHVVNVY